MRRMLLLVLICLAFNGCSSVLETLKVRPVGCKTWTGEHVEGVPTGLYEYVPPAGQIGVVEPFTYSFTAAMSTC